MTKTAIEEHLKKCSNQLELIRQASILKQAGEDEIVVNMCVTKLRKSMLRKGAKVKVLPSVAVAFNEKQPTGFIPMQVDNIASPIIVYDGTSILL